MTSSYNSLMKKLAKDPRFILGSTIATGSVSDAHLLGSV
jgi:hypothetical protein